MEKLARELPPETEVLAAVDSNTLDEAEIALSL